MQKILECEEEEEEEERKKERKRERKKERKDLGLLVDTSRLDRHAWCGWTSTHSGWTATHSG